MNNSVSFQDLKNRISISEIAERIGYRLNTKAGKKYLEYKLFNGNDKIDEIVVYTNNPVSQTYFSRNGIGDKGDLISFVRNRLSYFSNYQGQDYEAVKDILCKHIGGGTLTSSYKNTCVSHVSKFDINDYVVSVNHKIIYSYLNRIRRISNDTIGDFIKIGAVRTVSKKNTQYNITNVAFPFVQLQSPGDIVNFELRNFNAYKNTSYKGFCEGGNKASACWIASFSSSWCNVKNLYIGESALDMMALYQLLPDEEKEDVAFISVGGNLVYEQIKNLRMFFPAAVIHLSFDNDIQGNIYDVEAAYYLVSGITPKIYKSNDDIVINLYDTLNMRVRTDEFSSLNYLICNNLYPNWLHIHKATGAKDFNDMLQF